MIGVLINEEYVFVLFKKYVQNYVYFWKFKISIFYYRVLSVNNNVRTIEFVLK